MTFDFCWLFFHISLLLLVIAREFARKKNRNLFLILICSAFLVLISGQDWWMLTFFEDGNEIGINHLYQYISLPGVRLANFYVGLSVISFVILYFIKVRRLPNRTEVQSRNAPRALIGRYAYLFFICWIVAIIYLLTISAGGFINSLKAPGLNFTYGVTMNLILLSVGKMPLLYNIASKNEVRKLDIFLFLAVLFFTLINARLNSALMLLQLLILFNYCRYEISRAAWLLIVFFFFLIFIAFGLWREFASQQIGSQDLSNFFLFIVYYFDFKEILDWFYAANVESFSGLAGILTYDQSVGGIEHDFGISNLQFILQFIPGAVRADSSLPFGQFHDFFRSFYPYQNGSIISSGLEIAYANFWIFGVFMFGGVLGYLARFFHSFVLRPNSSVLVIGLISVQCVHLIRGTISNVLFFGFSDLIMLIFFKIVLLVFNGSKLSAVKRTFYE